jgi:hypothetical protein
MGHYDIGNLPKSQAAAMDVYNNALAAGAEDVGDNYVKFGDEAAWGNAVADLGLDVKPFGADGSVLHAMNKREQIGDWQPRRRGGTGFINFARVFAILDKAGIVENKEKRMSKQLKEEFPADVDVAEYNAAWDTIIKHRMAEMRDQQTASGIEDVITDAELAQVMYDEVKMGNHEFENEALGAIIRAFPGAITEAVTTPGVVVSRNMMIHVFEKGTNRKVDGGLVTKVTRESVFIGDEEYGKCEYSFLIIA